jgi:hypothetical protein
LPERYIIVECARYIKDTAVCSLVGELQRDGLVWLDLTTQVDTCIYYLDAEFYGAVGKKGGAGGLVVKDGIFKDFLGKPDVSI